MKKTNTRLFGSVMPDWEKDLLDEIARSLSREDYWSKRLAGWEDGRALGFSWHLAVLSSRSSRTCSTDQRQSNRGSRFIAPNPTDEYLSTTFYRLRVGGPIVAVAEAKETAFIGSIERSRNRFGNDSDRRSAWKMMASGTI